MGTNGSEGPAAAQPADVLVIGGGPAGCWAAWRAARQGARVVLADKGYVGTSGATAPSGTGVWYIPPEPEARAAAIRERDALGGHLADHGWSARVLDQTYQNLNLVAEWGYPFPVDEDGKQQRRSLQGPEYMRLMRRVVREAGVKIFDQSPATELLLDDDGRVAGARGTRRQPEGAWTVRAGAVVIATGGCAFLSKALGCNVLTGDGQLMAAEAGAELSGMEFSNAYGLGPAFSSVTKSAFYRWATFRHRDGTEIPGAGGRSRSPIARLLQQGRPVYAILDKATDEDRRLARFAQPNFFLSFDRIGLDPFTQLFPVTLRLEGTVRGTGGLRIVDHGCGTTVPGLFAAGDAATRELICGGFTGGGSRNAAWATSSGYWAGESAAAFALGLGANAAGRPVRGAAAERLRGRGEPVDAVALIRAVQDEVFPYARNYFRDEDGLRGALARLDARWDALRGAAAPGPSATARTREAVAMLANARWMYRSALFRTETRGMHKRTDFAGQDAAQQHFVFSGGLDEVWVRPQRAAWHATRPAPQAQLLELAA
ncbi:FAD-dependent oxidoreductase [Cupriavidus sp. PET2-C1]